MSEKEKITQKPTKKRYNSSLSTRNSKGSYKVQSKKNAVYENDSKTKENHGLLSRIWSKKNHWFTNILNIQIWKYPFKLIFSRI